MTLKSVTLHRVRIPFRKPVEHASARRTFTENVVVHVVTEDGSEGWGETIAREYVTGDTIDGVIERCRRIPSALWNRCFASGTEIVQFCSEADLGSANVARCAIEMALLDVLARRSRRPVSQLLADAYPEIAEFRNKPPFRYSGPLGVASSLKTVVTTLKGRMFGFAAVKIKMNSDRRSNCRRLRIARTVLGPRVDLRVDANESWTLELACAMAPVLRQYGVTAVEQPFHKTNLDDAEAFFRLEGIPLIFDESLCSEDDARSILQRRMSPIFAVKLAKLGGFHSTLRVLSLAAKHRVPIQISCQVGESAILSAAGRHLAALCPNLRYLEGSYDRFLLKENVTSEDITLGKGGYGSALHGPGLGISVDRLAIERLSVEKHVLF